MPTCRIGADESTLATPGLVSRMRNHQRRNREVDCRCASRANSWHDDCSHLSIGLKRSNAMKEMLSNVGKKEQRQINQLLNKEVKEDRHGVREAESRTVPKQHKLKGRKVK